MQTTKQSTKRLSDIVFDICTDSGLTIRDVISRNQHTEYVRCRQEIAREAIRYGFKIVEIARALKRTHSTVQHMLHPRDFSKKAAK